MSVSWKNPCGKALPLSERSYLKRMAASAEGEVARPLLVNIGVFRCASMYCLRAGSPGGRLVGIDIVPCDVPIQKGLWAEFLIGDSSDIAPVFKGPIHLLFIDGDHRYKAVKADLRHWAPKVAVGGIMILHDCHPKPKAIRAHPAIKGVNKACTEWFAASTGWIEIRGAPESLRAFARTQ